MKLLKNLRLFLCLILITFISLSLNIKINASNNKLVILGGDTIGLKLDTGVYVAGKYQVETTTQKVCPWINSDIKEGDKIVKINNTKISSNNELLNVLKVVKSNTVNLQIKRNDTYINTKIDVVTTKNNNKSIGLYIKDRILGIGTMTFVDPNTLKYAALGHGIYDDNLVIGTQEGNISKSTIEGIRKGVSGKAGEKKATLSNVLLGTISDNLITGVYGKVTNNELLKGKRIETASQNEIKTKKATIYTVIKDNTIEEFDILITDVNLQDKINVKGIKFEVIDETLLNKTGGIIQGMSGSPIVQDGKLIGAVSHVSIDDPSVGYGVHIEWMLDDISR